MVRIFSFAWLVLVGFSSAQHTPMNETQALQAEKEAARNSASALDSAEAVLGSLKARLHSLREAVRNESLASEEVHSGLQAAAREANLPSEGNYSLKHYKSQLHAASALAMDRVRQQVQEAKEAARKLKEASRQREHAQKAAGVHEKAREAGYNSAESQSEKLEEEAESIRDEAHDLLESIYEDAEDKAEQSAEQKEEQEEQGAEHDDQNDDEEQSAMPLAALSLAAPQEDEARNMSQAQQAVAKAQQDFASALQAADAALEALDARKHELGRASRNQTLGHKEIESGLEVAAREANLTEDTHNLKHYKSQLHAAFALAKAAIRKQALAAKEAARKVKEAGHRTKRVQDAAGVSERHVEEGSEHAERKRERLEGRIERAVDEANDLLGRIYEDEEERAERAAERQEEHQEREAEQQLRKSQEQHSDVSVPTLSLAAQAAKNLSQAQQAVADAKEASASALQAAEAALAALQTRKHDLVMASRNETLARREIESGLQDAAREANLTGDSDESLKHYRTRLHAASALAKDAMRRQAKAAKEAAMKVKEAGRQTMHAQAAAGMHERPREDSYDEAEWISQQLEGHAESACDKAEDLIERIFEKEEDRAERAAERKEAHAEKEAKQREQPERREQPAKQPANQSREEVRTSKGAEQGEHPHTGANASESAADSHSLNFLERGVGLGYDARSQDLASFALLALVVGLFASVVLRLRPRRHVVLQGPALG